MIAGNNDIITSFIMSLTSISVLIYGVKDSFFNFLFLKKLFIIFFLLICSSLSGTSFLENIFFISILSFFISFSFIFFTFSSFPVLFKFFTLLLFLFVSEF